MKKLIASVTMALVLTVAATAQVAVGVKGIGGMSLGTSLPEEMEEQIAAAPEMLKKSSVFAGGFGIYGRYYIPALPELGIQAEVDMLFNNGVSLDMDMGIMKMSMTYTYNTIELPVLVVYDIKAGPVTIGLNAGPNFVIPFGKLTASNEAAGEVEKTDVDITSKFIVGAIGGADVKFDMGPVTLGVGLQYEADFMPIMADLDPSGEPAEGLTRRGLRVSVGCEMKL